MKNFNDLQQKGHLDLGVQQQMGTTWLSGGFWCTMTTGGGYSSYTPEEFGVCCYQRLPLFGTSSQTQGLEMLLSTAFLHEQPLSSVQQLGFKTHCCLMRNGHPWSYLRNTSVK